MSIDVNYEGKKNGQASWTVGDIDRADVNAIIDRIIDELGIDESMISVTISVPDYVMLFEKLCEKHKIEMRGERIANECMSLSRSD